MSSDLTKRLGDLSPERRKLLLQRLKQAQEAPSPAARLTAEPGRTRFPLSFAQRRLWLLDRLEPGSSAFHMPLAMRMDGPVDAAVIEHALAEIVARHSSLRTHFEEDGFGGDEPEQVVSPPAPFSLPVVDLSSLPADERAREVSRLYHEAARAPFDLSRGPLFRASLLRLGEREHVLLWTVHHIVSDGWSSAVFFRELAALMAAFGRGEASPLPELPVQYGDFAAWQRERLAGEALEREVAWWKNALAGAPPLLELPTDRPRTPGPRLQGGSTSFTVPADVTHRLEEIGKAEGATQFMVLLAAWQALLSRWSGQDDVVVGTPMAARTVPEVEGLLGYFANTLVMRGDVSGDPSFRALLGRVKTAAVAAFEHVEVPFERLVEELAHNRGAAYTPVFQVVFTLQNAGSAAPGGTSAGSASAGSASTASASTASAGSASIASNPSAASTSPNPSIAPASSTASAEAPSANGSSAASADSAASANAVGPRMRQMERAVTAPQFDLALQLVPSPAGVYGLLEYDAALFDAETARRLLDHYARLLRGIAANPDAPVSALPLLSEDERARIVGEWSGVEADHQPSTFHALFEAQAARTPDAPALRFAGETVTFDALNARANRLARHLQALGVGPETRVALSLPRSPDAVATLLAIAKAGGAFVPVDPAYPRERRAFMLADSGAAVLVTTSDLAADIPETDARLVLIDRDAEEIERQDVSNLSAEVDPENAAYVVYTSGSTGRPKGVVVAHRGIANLARAQREALEIDANSRVLRFASLSFDAAFAEIAHTLLSGACLVIPSGDQTMPGPALLALMREERVSVATLPPSVLAAMEDADLPDLRTIVSAGEAVSADVARRWGEGRRFVNAYGPTETTVCATLAVDPPADARPPIGRAIANVRACVLDAWMQPAPVGVPGELYVGGIGVARGYLDQPALTAERFVPDPFSRQAGFRLYRTGDRVRWRTDGQLEFLGRLDAQVKIRGFRIEPGEIEAALLSHPDVQNGVVTVRDDGGEARLVAYAVARDGIALTADSLRAHLARTLPEHMVPSAFVLLDALPLTPNGKVDRAALPAPEAPAESYVEPRTPTEEALCALFGELLRRPRVGAQDDFFRMGGHSLLAMRAISRIRDRLEAELPLRAIFDAPTPAALAARVDEVVQAARGPEAPPLVRGDANDLPLSFAQERLWFIDRLQPGDPTYNISPALRLGGRISIPALERALGEMVRRHEALRTSFPEVDGAPVQRIAPAGDFHLPIDDLSVMEHDEAREDGLVRITSDFAWAPFDLANGPLFRARLVRMSDNDHALLVGMHHTVSDGWSMGVFWREAWELYVAFVEGRAPHLPPIPVRYADFAAWQRAWLHGEALERQLAFWKEELAGAPAVLELPTDHPRPPVRGNEGAQVSFELPADLSEALRAMARREASTLFMVMLAAYGVLLGRWARVADVVVGTPVAGRTRREVEGVVGYFANTLALRTEMSGDPTFRQLLSRVRDNTLGAFAHQDVPFEKLVEELHPERSLSHTPVFQVMLVLQNMPDARAAANEDGADPILPEVSGVGREGAVAKFDLMMGLIEGSDGLIHGGLEYAADLWEDATMERMARHFETLLRAVVARPDTPISALPLLGDAERSQLATWNATDRVYLPGLIHEIIADQARETPDAPALTFEGATLSYAELDARANRLANRLRSLGVGPEVRVGLLLERSPEMVIALLGVLKAGGAYVPLDPGYPAERLAYMAEDAKAAVLLTQSHLAPLVEAHDGPVVSLDAEWASIETESDVAPSVETTPDALAYVIYTSGSTGRPKGAMNAHRGVVNRLLWMQDEYGLDATDAVLQKTPFSFDVSVWEFFWPLMTGARLVLARPDGHKDPAYLADLISREGITTLHFVPSMLQAFLEEPGLERCASLRRVVCSGEALPAELQARFFGRMPASAELHNLYGPTEAAVDVTYWACERDSERRAVPIGRPVANTKIHVVEPNGVVAPIGVPGELCIAGVQVGRGYLARPGLSAEKFVPDPFSPQPGARMYRTGDLARWTAEGVLEYLGRIDHQVKLRGFRIELGEIEAALAAHASVREALVIVREDAPGDRRLAAYVVPADGERGVDLEELRTSLRERLPDYMVPGAWVVLAALPLTPNGKVDRKALPKPDAESAEAYVAPRTPAEEILAGVWAELLRVERVGAGDNFFDLGGHSLLATRLTSRVREAFGVELPLRAVFEAPVLSALAAEVERARRADAGTDAPPLVAMEREGDAPLSFAQERLWFVDRMDPGSPVFAMPFAYRLSGSVDVDALRRALNEIARRHEVLRTTFPMVDGVPVQRVAAELSVDLAPVDLSNLSGDADGEAYAKVAREHAAHPFDLERGPLFIAALVKLDADDHVLLLNLHHVVSDGWSLGVLADELSALYGAFARGEASPLPDLPIQYADYALWQRGWLRGEVLERQLGYWREKLSGAPPLLELPTDRPRPAVQTHRGEAVSGALPREAADAVLALGRREGATLFMTLLAAWSVVLSRLSGQDDVVVGTPIAGRTRRETEGMIGLFLNSLALRTDLSGDPSFRELLRRVRATTLEAYAHQDVPFERLLEELQPRRSLSHTPVFQVMLNLMNYDGGEVRSEGVESARVASGHETTSKFDATLYAGEGPHGLGMHLVYNPDLFGAARMREMLGQLGAVLGRAAEDPDLPLSKLSLVTDEARDALPDPRAPLDRTWRGSVPEIFARRAAETPSALASEDPSERWTYAELDAASNRIANRLIEAGVRSGDVVAIFGHRSSAIVRALLGTLKSGAAFLVLDPSYPSPRLAEYVRITAPRAFVRIAAAGDVPAEVASALESSSLVTIDLAAKPDDTADEKDSLASIASDAPKVEIGADSLAYLSFTSGTTGVPKAVMGRHGSLTHFTPWLASEFGLSSTDRFSLLSGLAHDPLHRDVFTPLQLGASVVAPDPEEIGTPGYLAKWLREAGVTVAHLTPALGQMIVDAGDDVALVESLRRAFFVGDVLTRADVDRLHRLAPNVTVVNYYGSTETQRAVSYFVVTRGATDGKEVIPLGRGIPGVQLLVRNAAGEPAGVGEAGEIWLRSPHVALGYLGDPALTAERFVINPWTNDPADLLYRTGDLGRYRPDGVVEPMGRADQQVKIRGFRVELGEIEATLAKHPSVREAVIVARGDAADRRLIGYAVPADGSLESIDSEALRAHLRAALPDFMVPSVIVPLEALPLTANRKIDRKALPEPRIESAVDSAAESSSDATSSQAGTKTEGEIAAIWREVLGVARVGADDDFFALGGHSLKATRVLSRIQQATGVRLPVKEFFANPTVRALAAAVDARRPASDVAAASADDALAAAREAGVYPLSFAQQRLWLLGQIEPTVAYNLPTAIRFRGALDVWALERALEEIVRRHEVLRTRFELRGDEPVQVVLPHRPLRLRVEDVVESEADRDNALRTIADEEGARPFPLAGPFLRIRLLRAASDDHVLLWTTHHVVSDGWSLGVLHGELTALYRAFSREEPSPLPPLPMQYGEHALAQRRALSGAALERQAAWWKERLAGAPSLLELPTDRPRPAIQSGRGASHAFALAPALGEAVHTVARANGATPFMVLLAAFDALLARWSGQDDVVVGTPIANRTRPQVEPLIGFFANTLAIRADLSGDPTFAALLARVRETTLGAYDHQDLPFEKLVEELQPRRSLAHTPVFQVMFIHQSVPSTTDEGARLDGLSIGWLPREREGAKFDLTLSLVESGGRYFGTVEYASDLFDGDTAARLTEQYTKLLESATDHPETPVSRLSILTDEERERVVDAWNQTTVDVPRGVRVHELFEAQARRTPEAVALTFDGRSMTYADLDRASSRVARRLRALGVGIESRVGVCVERGPGLVAALLGAWKAGGAYVPLDPSYPRDRLAYMVEDAGLTALVTEDRLREILPDSAVPVLLIDAISEDAEDSIDADASADSVDSIDSPASDATLAYVIYTSGSTGRPKGVMVPHATVVNFLASMREAPGLTPDDALLAVTTASFDISVLEIFLPLTTGARVVLASRDEAADGARLRGLIAASGATVMQATPATWRMLLEAGWLADSTLKLLCGGEALPRDLANALTSNGAPLWNLYGPTETTVWSTAERVDADDDGPTSIGRPIANTRVYVLDAALNPAPSGVPGELFIAGDGVARGYLHRPSLTADRFIPDPFAANAGARMYRTGDRARWRADGRLEYLGRLDAQVKVRGHRIEPGEVEAALLRHPSVRQAVAVAREDTPGDARLVAYLMSDDVPPAELRALLRETLPDYMVPSAFVRLDALPLTRSGKVDRRALPAPGRESAAAYVAPRDEAEAALAALFAEVLGTERVGAADGFFDLGGHSLLAVRLMSRITQRFGRELPLATLFQHPTPAELATLLRDGASHGADGARSPLVAFRAEGTLPPLFLVHPAGGTAFRYADLARHLDPARPVFALQAAGLAEGERPVESVEEMAARYVEAIREARPRGPYLLGGWSAGGVIAQEMARLLRDAGGDVPLLVLFDADVPRPDWEKIAPDDVELLRRFTRGLGGASEEALLALVDELRALPPEDRLRGLADWIARSDLGIPDTAVAQIGRAVDVFRATVRAVNAFEARPYDGPVLLLQAAEGIPGQPETRPGGLPGAWRPFLRGPFAVREVPGTHGTLVFEPHVSVLAPVLERALMDAVAGSAL